ncbi:Pyrimidine nucleotide transporter, mitochondrial [Komagataella phaffii CBS 7435]|uniref:Mitochondrial pyrimidine nucleotide transporter n=2 Tax=Komagataella phaffii TaxID=460519 RepID=C4QYF0_KOMPG|nr:Mitochondrial pyrimidine nucleotide transporter [Komagataella phaffii GS115]AOA61204.1 GQ67_01738T0 [Komagataella phaffii]KAI0464364.1 hypothetical protein LJB42_001977 [Komagataella kurtzmanii]CAH2447096.1 Pyrimidine nucleotide transporter, mitochondrial [Komagataella phaffii CBS 7435]AOA65573.1 GQ68_01753T0 [Komagataella phaffii GS115]CAY68273.1 Mitochondrial pyrimidine nucleotide transporter [Komagataella phaffii GS115]
MANPSRMEKIERIAEDVNDSITFLSSDEKASSFRNAEPKIEAPKLSIDRQEVKPWVNFVAGGLGGMAGAVFTCPFDVVKTRLQSSVYQDLYRSTNSKGANVISSAARHISETCSIIGSVYRVEGIRALFKGLGPNLVGVIPARSINFFTYGYSKDVLRKHVFDGEETSLLHLLAGLNAGFVTSTATNPIWLVKTRLQLDKSSTKQYKNSWDCISKILKVEGVSGLYKGLSASYLGSIESTLQWILYEQMKSFIKQRSLSRAKEGQERTSIDELYEWAARSGAAGAAKFMASLITYPHEVVRTRLRQAPMENGRPKYTGLLQSFKLIIKEEGLASMYGGLTPHMMRTVPNSIIMFGTWELFISILS